MTLSREARSTPETDVVAMTAMVLGLPRVPWVTKAIAVLPGFHEPWCLNDAARTWEGGSTARHLLVAGDGLDQPRITLGELERDHGVGRIEGVIIQPGARHTKHQAEWLMQMVTDRKLESVSLFASPSHLLRGYGTLLKTMLDSSTERIPILPVPVRIAPATKIPRINQTQWELVASEVERIIAYQQKGDMVTRAELEEYLDWLWNSPIAEQW